MKLKFILSFFIIVGLVALVLEYEKKSKIEQYIENTTKEHRAMYDAIYYSFKKRSDIAYSIITGNKEIIEIYKNLQTADEVLKIELRNQFKDIINAKYSTLKTQGIKIINFHLSNNESFFRFHKQEQFGDDLTKVRQTLEYVNRTHKKVDGFEVGKYFSGYRFIYPIKDENDLYLGSLEVSFDLAYYVKEFIDTLNVLSNFRIKKPIVDAKFKKEDISKAYKQSKIQGYYVPRKVLSQLTNTKKEQIKKLLVKESTIAKGVNAIEKDKSISVYDLKSHNLITFIPVKNPVSKEVCGFITIRTDDRYIYNKTINSYFILALFAISTLGGLIFLYRQIKSQKELNKILKEEVAYKTKKLREVNENLEMRVKEEVDKNIKQEIELFKKSKLVAMGDMIGNIAHQWRQPLSAISAVSSGVIFKQEMGILQNSDIKENMENINVKVSYLSETIETFRNYLKETKQTRQIVIQDRLDIALNITKTVLDDCSIKLINETNTLEPIRITTIPGEITEVLINIINNAKDILVEKKINDPWIKIELLKEDENILITIEDNGGGIPQYILPNIFDQYFTTKDDDKGTGLGLHMSKKIIEESLGGKLSVSNTESGAKFSVKLVLH